MITIIAGSRGITWPGFLGLAIHSCPWQISQVYGGEARGPDQLGKQWAKLSNVPYLPYPADWWSNAGKGAGIVRNERMGKDAQALVALWDGESSGTCHMIEFMRSLSKPVHVVSVPRWL